MEKSQQLHQFNSWANERVFDTLKELPTEMYRKDVESVFPTIADVLVHMYQVDYVWLQVLKGETFEDIFNSIKQLHEELNAADLKNMQMKFEAISEDYENFIRGKEDLSADITVHHPHFGTLHSTYADLMQHIVNHGTYHRGHLSAILNQLGYKGASIDYIFYLYSLQEKKQTS
ncbi:DinB family protein [Fictibacillus norfolkensis]|uniref:DinB family protein n=1 Tax=Fictibacillus norfolkensis TaxID=2762233 RepID=A0ABR8SHJ8_9BACL|nr:DinB family protein [Fictibacillus norfolkensis]MBD7962933.1 DinB family protein [Fictibacillus norfolkensis]